MRGGLALACGLVLAACAGVSSTTSTVSTPSTVAATSPTSTLPPVVDCPGVGEFVEGGGVADIDGEGSDSTRLGRISWETSEQCESFDFEFETSEGAPATMVPDVEVEYLDSLQVIRLRLDIGSASLVDQLVETDLVERMFVVGALDGSVFVDLHLAAPAAARARVTSEPARLSLDLRPGFLEFAGVSTLGDGIVVVSPTDGTEVDPGVAVAGYVAAVDSEVRIEVSHEDTDIEQVVTERAGALVWGEFSQELTLRPGEVSIFVVDDLGEEAGGLTISLTVR